MDLSLETALPDHQSRFCFLLRDRLRDDLDAIAFVSVNLTVGIDLTFEDDGFKIRVEVVSKETIGLELLECMEPLLSVIVEHVFGVHDGNIEVLESSTD